MGLSISKYLLNRSVLDSQDRWVSENNTEELSQMKENILASSLYNNYYLSLFSKSKQDTFRLFYLEDMLTRSTKMYMEFFGSITLGFLYPRTAILLTSLRTFQILAQTYLVQNDHFRAPDSEDLSVPKIIERLGDLDLTLVILVAAFGCHFPRIHFV